MWVGGQLHALAALYPRLKTPVPIVQDAGPVWTGAENLPPPTGVRSPDHPARSESLYRLSYPGSFRYSNLVNDVHLYEHISSYVHPHCGDVLFLVLPVVALFEMHGRTIPFATCSEEDLPLGALTAYTQ